MGISGEQKENWLKKGWDDKAEREDGWYDRDKSEQTFLYIYISYIFFTLSSILNVTIPTDKYSLT